MTKLSREIKNDEIVQALKTRGGHKDVWATGFIPNSNPQMPPHYVLEPIRVSISKELDEFYGNFKVSHNKQDYWEPSHAIHFFTTKKIATEYFEKMVNLALEKHESEVEIVLHEMDHVRDEIEKYKH